MDKQKIKLMVQEELSKMPEIPKKAKKVKEPEAKEDTDGDNE